MHIATGFDLWCSSNYTYSSQPESVEDQGGRMLDYRELKKPEHLTDEIWRQHLQWMDVMGRQVDENFARHLVRAEKDGRRTNANLTASP